MCRKGRLTRNLLFWSFPGSVLSALVPEHLHWKVAFKDHVSLSHFKCSEQRDYFECTFAEDDGRPSSGFNGGSHFVMIGSGLLSSCSSPANEYIMRFYTVSLFRRSLTFLTNLDVNSESYARCSIQCRDV